MPLHAGSPKAITFAVRGMPISAVHNSAERARLAALERTKANLKTMSSKPIVARLQLPAAAGPQKPPPEEDFLSKLSAAEHRDSSRREAESSRADPTGGGDSVTSESEAGQVRFARANLEEQQRKVEEAATMLVQQKALVAEHQARTEQLNSELAKAEARQTKQQQPPSRSQRQTPSSAARLPRPPSPRASSPHRTSSGGKAVVGSSPRLDQLSKAKKRPDSPHNHRPPAVPSQQPSTRRPPSARASIGPAPAPSMAVGGAEMAAKAPSELRKEILVLRAQLEEAAASASRAQEEARAAQEALDAERSQREDESRAQEERFDDMTSFMEGLLKNLKAENTFLREELSREQQQRRELSRQRSQEELDEFERLELHIAGSDEQRQQRILAPQQMVSAARDGEGKAADAAPEEEAAAEQTEAEEEASRPKSEAADVDTPASTARGESEGGEGPARAVERESMPPLVQQRIALSTALADEDELPFREDHVCPSPLREARMHRFVMLDEEDEEQDHEGAEE